MRPYRASIAPRARADAGSVGDIQTFEVHAGNLGAERLEIVRIAHGGYDAISAPRKLQREGASEPSRRTGDHDHFAA